MLFEIAVEEWARALDACVAELLARERVCGPPVDAVQLANGLGIDIAYDATQPGRARLVRMAKTKQRAGQSAVFLRPEPRSERIHWAVAHEIGETLAHQVCGELGIDLQEAASGERERLANQLATRLLLPECWFASDATQCDWDLPTLKRRYATASHELIARRMLDFPGSAVISIYDHGRLSLRRAAGGRRAPKTLPAERHCWQEVHTSGQTVDSAQEPIRVRGWAIHEPGWKREILRIDWLAEWDELAGAD